MRKGNILFHYLIKDTFSVLLFNKRQIRTLKREGFLSAYFMLDLRIAFRFDHETHKRIFGTIFTIKLKVYLFLYGKGTRLDGYILPTSQ